MIFPQREPLCKVAEEFNASYHNLNTDVAFLKEYQKSVDTFKTSIRAKRHNRSKVKKEIKNAYRKETDADTRIAEAYDAEYKESNYAYLNALLCSQGYVEITGYLVSQSQKLRVLDVGAGSNEFLRFCRDELLIPSTQLFGCDISAESQKRIESDGFKGYLGRPEDLHFPSQIFDLLSLSYFIDYDTNQRATINEAVRLTQHKGKIVFEGLLPCLSGEAIVSRLEKETTITRGRSVSEDTALLCRAFIEEGIAQGRTIVIEKIVTSHRYIYNQLGFKKRPSTFIVVRVD